MSQNLLSPKADPLTNKNPLMISQKYKNPNFPTQESKIQQPYSSKKHFKFIIKSKVEGVSEDSPQNRQKSLIDNSIWESENEVNRLCSPYFNSAFAEDLIDSNNKNKDVCKNEDKEKINMSVFTFGKRTPTKKLSSLELKGFQDNSEKHIAPFVSTVNEKDEINLKPEEGHKRKKTPKKMNEDSLEMLERLESNENSQQQDTIDKVSTNEEIKKKPKPKTKTSLILKKFNNLEDMKRTFTSHLNYLKNGKIFLKFGRKNIFGPAKRKIIFNDEMNCFFWMSPKRKSCDYDNESKIAKKFDLKDIIEVLDGRKSPNFKRFKTTDEEKIKLSFSIVLNQRTVDLQAMNLKDKEDFLTSFIKIMLLRKKMMLGDTLKIKF